jgi:hypothetical protein
MSDLDLVAKHKYVTSPGGEPGINVTAISGLLDDGKSNGMAGAAAKLTREGLNYREEWKAAADNGSRRHSICENWLTTGESFCAPEDEGFVDGLEKFWVDHSPEKIECEAIALSTTHGYGGRFDMVVRLSDGRVLLIDLKTGKRYAAEHTLQLSAYRYADGLGVYENGMLTELRPMPKVDACAALYVASDGTYSLIEYPADDAAFSQFLNLLLAYRWKRSPVMKAAEKSAKL